MTRFENHMDAVINSFYPDLACEINGHAMSIFRTEDGKWHWKTAGLTWDDLGFMSSRGHPGFMEAREAQQDAMERMNDNGIGTQEGL